MREQRGATVARTARCHHAAGATCGPVRSSLIIVTKSRPAPLRGALESSLRTLPADAEVVVVDGDPERSAAGVVAELQARHADQQLRYVASSPVPRGSAMSASTLRGGRS